MLIVDAHLDLAFNALSGRDVTLVAERQPANESGTATVGLPDLRRGGASLVCGTLFCEPAGRRPGCGYRTPDEAFAAAEAQLVWYQRQFAAGELALVTRADELPKAAPPAEAKYAIPTIILMEGADPIRTPADVEMWFNAGVRIVGLAWRRTRYAGGTGEPGPLTADGIQLVKVLDRFGLVHDVSHLAEQSFWQLLELSGGPVMASHSNARRIIPTDRQLSDDMIRALVARGGVVGINFYQTFLLPPHRQGRAGFDDVIVQIRCMCEIAGDASHVSIGTDLDGGFGREKIPQEMETWADLRRLADALAGAGFADDQIKQIMGENWLRFFRAALPSA